MRKNIACFPSIEMNRSMANGDMRIVDFGLDDLDLEFGIFWIRCHASSTSRRDFACSKKQEAKFWRERVANSTWHCEYSTWPGVKVPPPEFHVAGESKQRSRIQIPRGSCNRVALEYLLLPDAGLPTMMIRLQRNLQDNPVYIIVYRLHLKHISTGLEAWYCVGFYWLNSFDAVVLRMLCRG